MATELIDLELNKLKGLYSLFNNIIEMQKIRINTKELEINIMKNRLKEEFQELESLKQAEGLYENQVNTFLMSVKNYEANLKKQKKGIKKNAIIDEMEGYNDDFEPMASTGNKLNIEKELIPNYFG